VEFLPGGKITLKALSIKQLVSMAWDMREEYVTGGAPWLDTEHYDIVAKAPVAVSDSVLMTMAQNLLIDRFRLELHKEKRVMPVFVLTAGKKGPKLQESTAPGTEESSCKLGTPQDRKDGLILRTLVCKNTPISYLAERLPGVAAAYLDQPVVDLTELKGRYDFTLEWAPRHAGRGAAARGVVPPAGAAGGAREPAPSADPEGATIFNAVQSQLGLKLEPRKHPMDILVIDKVERHPTEN
jgi:uncharacterized protein (TIGR03435 family)